MKQTLLERLGGEEVVLQMTHYLYVNLFRDEQLKPFFENINITRQTHKMQAFLSYVFGGDTSYKGVDLRAAHKQAVAEGLNDTHIDAMIDCVCATLKEMGVDNNIIGEVAQVINQHRDEVLNR